MNPETACRPAGQAAEHDGEHIIKALFSTEKNRGPWAICVVRGTKRGALDAPLVLTGGLTLHGLETSP